ncbi:hypothetical protein IWX90DRAFT_488546 [Phyllosticta citrichinensis]|uniref:Uncharacterized protein n=1 Tax=Phyllosticta citrichinensis TaxID=1130410 RepID=A0ABR1XPH8_9PEZI
MSSMNIAKTTGLPLDWDDDFEELCINAPQTNLELAALTATKESPQDDSWVLMNKPNHSINFVYTLNIVSDQNEAQQPQIPEGTVPNAIALHTTPGAATPDTKCESVTLISSRESEQKCDKNLENTAPHATLYTTFCNTLGATRQDIEDQAYNKASATEVPLGSEEETKELEQSRNTPATIIDMVKSVGMFLWDCWDELPLILTA